MIHIFATPMLMFWSIKLERMIIEVTESILETKEIGLHHIFDPFNVFFPDFQISKSREPKYKEYLCMGNF